MAVCEKCYFGQNWGKLHAFQVICKDKECNLGAVAGY